MFIFSGENNSSFAFFTFNSTCIGVDGMILFSALRFLISLITSMRICLSFSISLSHGSATFE